MKRPVRLWIAILLLFLGVSLVVNVILFSLAIGYYRQFHEVALDPLGLLAASVSEASETENVILLYGDSRAAHWPMPATLNGYSVVNHGIDGQTSVQANLRIPYHVAPLQPDILILQTGVNDLKTIPLVPHRRQEIIQQTQINIRQIIESARWMNTTVILTTIFPAGNIPLYRFPFWSDDVYTAIDEVNAYLQTLASEDVIVFDTMPILADEARRLRTEYADDELHLNLAGYAALNDAILPVIQETLTRRGG